MNLERRLDSEPVVPPPDSSRGSEPAGPFPEYVPPPSSLYGYVPIMRPTPAYEPYRGG